MKNLPRLNSEIELEGIFNSVKNQQNIKFLATAKQLNLKYPSKHFDKIFYARPINPPEEVLKILLANAKHDINTLILFCYIQNAEMVYKKWDEEGIILVEITF